MSRYTDSHATSYAEVTDWRAAAACVGHDPEIFFADAKDVGSQHDRQRAKAICGACLSRVECLADALEVEGNSGPAYRHGIRGGLTAGERGALWRREQRRAETP